ncbi:MAG TPA: AAA family ATPase [Candidatus Nanopelagicales bacterium]|nr:AAA family ATPase [Candidatus Nanopelagicales bacterium]
MNRISRLKLDGFKTFRKPEEELVLRPLNVLIGPNGAGKSNLISFFRMLSWMFAPPGGRLQSYVEKMGRAHKLLHDGPGVTENIDAELTIETDRGTNDYAFRLSYAAEDTLFFDQERYRFTAHGHEGEGPWREAGSGHRESALFHLSDQGLGIARAIKGFLQQYKVYQFHNTSFTSRLRQVWNVRDAHALKEDGGNLAPVLLRIREEDPQTYRRIVNTLRLTVPSFQDFELIPRDDSLLLAWREEGSDMVFDASQASDGTLRTFALVTLLGQPIKDLPDVLLLDEPELGLHPHAISILGGMLQRASCHAQVVVATQSPTLLDSFTPEDILVVERRGRASTIQRPDPEALAGWLDEYSLGQVWLKNLLGGRP